jgi:acetoin utilization protein AcuB
MTQSRKLPIQDYMSRSLLVAEHGESIVSAHQRLRANRVGQLPVVDAGKLVGVIFQRDLAIVEHLPKIAASVTVGAVMTREFYTVGPDEPVDRAARTMAKHKYHAALVVEEGRPLGVFTTTDALRALSDSLTDSLPGSELED